MSSSELQSNYFDQATVLPHASNTVPLIYGENIGYFENCQEGSINLTNYRIILEYKKEEVFSIPIAVIYELEVRRECLHISCKDAKSFKCTFDSSEMALDWQNKVNEFISVFKPIEKIFAVSFCRETSLKNPKLYSALSADGDDNFSYSNRSDKIFEDEIRRLGFDHGPWRISKMNENYKLCSSYPQKLVVPSCIGDDILKGTAEFRYSERIPTSVWRHSNGAVIARCSQPRVGLPIVGLLRSNDDEYMVKALSETCASVFPSNSLNRPANLDQNEGSNENMDKNGGRLDESGEDINSFSTPDFSVLCTEADSKRFNNTKKLLIMDARKSTAASANRVRGGGYEHVDYYTTCEVRNMDMENIHMVTNACIALRNIPADAPNYLSSLESGCWLTYLSGLIKSAVKVVQAVDVEARPVLVHCSDGWDRTPQIVSMAEILMDPYYRTFEGFRILIEREWLDFGHKFMHRTGCRLGPKTDEQSPIFMQWLDGVFQVMNQCPTAFEFSQAYLVKLVQHVYSNMFDTFLFNCAQERFIHEKSGKNKMFSIWPYLKLNRNKYINHLYAHGENQVLWPSYYIKDLVLWKALYANPYDVNRQNSSNNAQAPPPGELAKTKSCNSLPDQSPTASVSLSNRRSSQPNLCDSILDSLMKIGGESQKVSTTHIGNGVIVNPAENSGSDPKKGFIPCDPHLQHHEGQNVSLIRVENGEIVVQNSSEPETSGSDPKDADTSFLEDASQHFTENNNNDILTQKKNGIVKNSNNSGSSITSLVNIVSKTIETFYSVNPSGVRPLNSGNHLSGASPLDARSLNTIPIETGVTIGTNKSSSNVVKTSANLSKPSSSSGQISLKKSSSQLSGEIGGHEPIKINNTNRYKESKSNRPIINDICDSCKNFKTFINGSFDLKTIHSNSDSASSSGSKVESEEKNNACDDVTFNFSDGLSNYSDELTRRLEQIKQQHQREVNSLKRELERAKAHIHNIHYNFARYPPDEDPTSLPDSAGSTSNGESVTESSSLSVDASWEAIEDPGTTLWVPDHAVVACMNCRKSFSLVCRRHHCRGMPRTLRSSCTISEVVRFIACFWDLALKILFVIILMMIWIYYGYLCFY